MEVLVVRMQVELLADSAIREHTRELVVEVLTSLFFVTTTAQTRATAAIATLTRQATASQYKNKATKPALNLNKPRVRSLIPAPKVASTPSAT